MSHITIESSHTDDERWIDAGGDAFAVHIAAIAYCDRQLTDGRISAAMARRVSLAVAPNRTAAAIAVLLDRGFWAQEDDGYRIVDFHQHAFPAEQVKATRARWKTDKDRRRQHDVGDHSLCKDPKYCPAIRDGSTVETGVDSTVEVNVDARAPTQPNPIPTQPNPTQPDRRERVGVGNGGPESAALTRTDTDPEDNPAPQDSAPTNLWNPVGDCPHTPGGLDTGLITGRMRCEECREAKRRAAKRAELDEFKAQRGLHALDPSDGVA